MKPLYTVAFLLFLSLRALTGYGQQPDKLVSGNFVRVPFEQFATQLEAQTATRIYFDPAAVDSLFVTLQVQQQPLRSVLQQALQNTLFRFAIDEDSHVFITKGPAIETGLTPGFFQQATSDNAVATRPDEEQTTTQTEGRSRYLPGATI